MVGRLPVGRDKGPQTNHQDHHDDEPVHRININATRKKHCADLQWLHTLDPPPLAYRTRDERDQCTTTLPEPGDPADGASEQTLRDNARCVVHGEGVHGPKDHADDGHRDDRGGK